MPATDPNQHGDDTAPDPHVIDRTSARQRTSLGWQIERIETVPMTAAQYDDAVAALAALIATWLQHETGSGTADTGPAASPPSRVE